MSAQGQLPLSMPEEAESAEQALREAFGRMPTHMRRLGFQRVANDRLYGRVLRLTARAAMKRRGK